ncbi:MAG: hypothetical protein HZB42_00820 [Sphingobacteriales bacterium]|nr:hypothetical protein [Sphingobacteriales bacterium]
MKQVLLIVSASLLFGFTQKENIVSGFNDSNISKIRLYKNSNPGDKSYDDIYVSFDYLTDATGYKYGAVFYLYNPNEYTVSIQWQFVGYYNVNFSPTNSDRTTIPGKTKIWITNVTSADHSKAWSSGKVQWKY